MKVAKRRRRENRTDYGKRLKLLKSEKPRIVFRNSNRYILAQYVESENAQDKIKFGVSSKDLLKNGWQKNAEGSLKSVTASYLTGFLMGKKIAKENLETPIIDFGMKEMKHKSRTYGFIKGLIDAGIKVKCDKEFFPDESRIKGEHLKNKVKFNEIKSQIEKNG